MAKKSVQACLRFEDLFYRDELTDEEAKFVLDHLSSCAVHTPENMRLVRSAFYRMVEEALHEG